jgi:uncharacterized protein YbjT (DUF2867 family)
MFVLITAGAGYVGSHAVEALIGAAHRVRLLARSLAWIGAALPRLGVDHVEPRSGDVTGPAAVERDVRDVAVASQR